MVDAVDEQAGVGVVVGAFLDFEVADGFARALLPGEESAGAAGDGAAGEVSGESLPAWRSWPLSSMTARRLRMLLERLAKRVTTAAIMMSVMAVAISISMRVRPGRDGVRNAECGMRSGGTREPRTGGGADPSGDPSADLRTGLGVTGVGRRNRWWRVGVAWARRVVPLSAA